MCLGVEAGVGEAKASWTRQKPGGLAGPENWLDGGGRIKHLKRGQLHGVKESIKDDLSSLKLPSWRACWAERGQLKRRVQSPLEVNAFIRLPRVFLYQRFGEQHTADCRGVQTHGISGPHWKKSGLGPHIKYIMNAITKKSHEVLSKFLILCWAEFTAILGCMQPTCCRLDPLTAEHSS